uniref:hypothetical protein n=1 Tax=Falsiroseomonas oryzae TaxID=2766473 RepID=UPI0022EB939A
MMPRHPDGRAVTPDEQAWLRRCAVSLYAMPDDLPLDRFCAMVAARGLGGVGLTARAVQALEPAALGALLRAHGLVATSLNS